MIGNSQVFGQGESSKTGFFLNSLPNTVIDGEPIKFSGYVLTGDGTPLADRTITIKQDISCGH
jgi:protocatechuate 3,4-dioxygenase beta subunit